MKDSGRNDPCPCGSGKKYKKCCLPRVTECEGRRRDEGYAVGTALQWLSENHPDAVETAIHGDYFGELADEEIDLLDDLPPEARRMLDINVGEWLLADAVLTVEGEGKRARDLLFAPGGPVLPTHGRQWLEALGERAIGLYEVTEVKPGEGLRLQDSLRPEEPPTWVRERSASRALVQWDVLGARLARQDDDWVLTGTVYPLGRREAKRCRDEILRDMKGKDWGSAFARDLVGAAVSSHWLANLVEERPLPQFVDASTREPLMLVTDHYQVTDWGMLETVLARQVDVEGSRQNGWTRFVELDGDMRRSRAALNVREPDRLEVFCRTMSLANEARAWLQATAGHSLAYRTREVVDPLSPKAREAAAAGPVKRPPPEIEGQALHHFLRKHYENWTDEPLPVLGNRTPRESTKTAKGRGAVVDLLKSYEQHEARRAKRDGNARFDFGFLWERLGLKRDG